MNGTKSYLGIVNTYREQNAKKKYMLIFWNGGERKSQLNISAIARATNNGFIISAVLLGAIYSGKNDKTARIVAPNNPH